MVEDVSNLTVKLAIVCENEKIRMFSLSGGGRGFELEKFRTFFVPGGWGIRPFKKFPRGMVRLGIDWYIMAIVW